jgi:hypothetical protein
MRASCDSFVEIRIYLKDVTKARVFGKRYRPLKLRSMHPVIRIVLFTLILVSSVRTVPGQQASASLATPNPAPTPIPLAKVALETQSALASLQEIDAGVSKDQSSADGVARTLVSGVGNPNAGLPVRPVRLPSTYRILASALIDPVQKFDKPLAVDPKKDFVVLGVI